METTSTVTPTTRTMAGWGVDLKPENRPGVPMEKRLPTPVEGARWERPDRQKVVVEVLKRADLGDLTPTFGTRQPPHGLSGMIKRVAYKIPDHRPSHWMLLLLSDRVDVVESALREPHRNAGTLLKWGAMAGALIAVNRLTRRR